MAASACTFAAVMRSDPPPGMASRALMARLTTALSNWFESVSAGHRSCGSASCSAMFSPQVVWSMDSSPASDACRSTGRESSGWRRENASNRCVKPAARLAAAKPDSI
ncbi:hypothetical protein D3C72_1545690 [compost metagenome]